MVLGQVGLLADALTTVPTVGPEWATPAFLAALATLIASITGLVVALKSLQKVTGVQATADSHTASIATTDKKVDQVVSNTNGVMAGMEKRISQLEALLGQAGIVPPPRSDPPPGATPPPAPG